MTPATLRESRSPAPTPWYRETWPWLLMAGPAIVVVAGFITLAMALNSNDGLVADDYFKQGKEVNRDLTRDDEARRMGLSAVVAADPAARTLDIVLQSSLAPAQLTLRLAHATRGGQDRLLTAVRSADGHYRAAYAPIEPGKWYLMLDDATRRWRLGGTALVAADGRIALTLAPRDN